MTPSGNVVQLTGSCLCGTVTYEVTSQVSNMLNCHCTYCRKSHGAAFATYMAVPKSGFRFVSGTDHIASYRSTPVISRNFCDLCGSIMPFEEGDHISIPAGTLTSACDSTLVGHILVASKASYYDITDGLKVWDAMPTSMGRDPAPTPKRDDEGLLTGSCLCNAVAFRVSEPATGMMNCHCDRCKRSRSAAHATNVFVKASAFEWLRGKDLVVHYKLPEAERFGAAFCRNCGSLVPRAAPGYERAGIPAGCLDQDPGIRPRAHIHVSRKASWFTITDGLEQFSEGMPRP